jgi:copper(I)-binding protein
MSGFTESKLCTVSGSLNLNGEYIYVTNIEDFDKKMVVISHKVFNDGEIHKEINNDDIVLYFA